MIVGKAVLDVSEVRRCVTKDKIYQYAESLIPEEFRHVNGIVDNQVYLVCMVMRKIDAIPWSVKRPLLDEALKGIRIIGYLDCLVEAGMIWDFVDSDTVNRYGREKCR